MNPFFERDIQLTRRQFLSRSSTGIGGAALASILGGSLYGANGDASSKTTPGMVAHHVAKAKRVIYLMQGGGPSHVDLLDYKPMLTKRRGMQLPDSVRMGQRELILVFSSDQAGQI